MKTKNKIINLYLMSKRIREIELEISKRYKNQKMRCPIHLSIGQESIAVGCCLNLSQNDEVVTAHRSHAHYLAKGGNLKKMISELHGKKTGCALGLGGSMHLIDLKSKVVGAVPIVGSSIAIGTGKAWANKLNKSKNIVVIFFGDGATEEGIFLESLDFASLHSLGVIFVCENNEFSVFSSKKNRQNKDRNLCKMAKSLGVESFKLRNHDLKNIYNKFENVMKKIRKKPRPYLIEIDTYRSLEHCGPNNDDHLGYRDQKMIKNYLKKCQINKIENEIIKKKILNKDQIKAIEKNINKEITDAFIHAEKSSYPTKNVLKKLVYSKNL